MPVLIYPNYPFSLCSIAVIRYSPALNNRGTAQFASFATKACEFNEKIIFIRKYCFLIDCIIPKTKIGWNENNNVLFYELTLSTIIFVSDAISCRILPDFITR